MHLLQISTDIPSWILRFYHLAGAIKHPLPGGAVVTAVVKKDWPHVKKGPLCYCVWLCETRQRLKDVHKKTRYSSRIRTGNNS